MSSPLWSSAATNRWNASAPRSILSARSSTVSARSVAAASTSDLGLKQGEFLVAVIGLHTGHCDCCHEGRLVVIDLARKQVAWTVETQGAVRIDERSGRLRLFRLFPDESPMTVAVRSSWMCYEQSDSMETETWYRPRRTSSDNLAFETIWEGNVEESSWWLGASRECAQMTSLWPRRAYRYAVHQLVGWVDTARSDLDDVTEARAPCGDTGAYSAVDFISTSVLTYDQSLGRLTAKTAPALERRDLQPTVTFPFNLPVRRLLMEVHRLELAATSKVLPNVQAPGGNLVASALVTSNVQDRKALEIRRVSDSGLVRRLPTVEWLNGERPGEYMDPSFTSVGWTRDGRRCLAVVEVGLGYGPVLVSLGPDGKDDAWEGLLPRDKANLGDGFILDLPEPTPTPASPPTKNP